MAKPHIAYTTGKTVKVVYRDSNLDAWNGSAYETWNDPDLTTQYQLACSEQGTSGFYYPTAAPPTGWYLAVFYEGTQAIGECSADASGTVDANVVSISGDAAAADALESYCDGTTPMPVNATQLSGDATAADALEAALDGTGGVTLKATFDGNLSGKVLGGGSGTITGTGVRADDRDGAAIAKASSLTTVGNDVLEVLDRLGAFAGSGINTVLGFFQALFRSDMTIPTNIGGTYHPALHSLEALRARGDAAWYATPGAVLLETTISSLTNQTLFALSAGSSDNTAYVGALAIIAKSGSPTRKCFGVVAGYSGGTRTVVLAADPGIFTIAVGDSVTMIAQTELTAAAVWQNPNRSLTQSVDVGGVAGSGEAALVMAALYGTGATRTTVSTVGTPAAGAFNAAFLDDSPVLSEEDDFYKGQLLVFTSGPNVGANRKISGYVAATRTFTFAGAAGRSDAPFDFAPTADDAFVVLGRVG